MAYVCPVCNSQHDDGHAQVTVGPCSKQCEKRAENAYYDALREQYGVPCGVCFSVECVCHAIPYSFGEVS